MRILVQFPTRERKDTFFSVIDDYYKLAKNLDKCLFHVVIDENDATMNDPETIKRLDGMKNCIHTISKVQGKIQAINLLPEDNKWDILLLVSDDMIAKKAGWDEEIRNRMKECYPDTDGVLWYNDGYVGKRLNTLVCIGKSYYNRFRYVYHPSYKSLWCDNEFTDVANALQKQTYFSECIIRHEHPANNGKKRDLLYVKNEKLYDTDRLNYEQRKKNGFPGKELLSVLICTLKSRESMRNSLVEKLSRQICKENAQKLVELLYCDDPKITIGEKRNFLIKNSNGKYVCFVDDDDDVSDDYIKLILEALKTEPDCLSLHGTITTNGRNPKTFVHSLRYDSYFIKNDVYYRPPNHLNVIKKSLVESFKFPEKNFSEDTDWALAICNAGILKYEVEVPIVLYFYKFSTK